MKIPWINKVTSDFSFGDITLITSRINDITSLKVYSVYFPVFALTRLLCKLGIMM